VTTPPGWPVELQHGDVAVRPFHRRDATAWSEVRLANEAWLSEWESLPPGTLGSYAERHSPAAFRRLNRTLRASTRAGTHMSFAVTHKGQLAGQVTVGNIVRASFNSAYLGYWVDGRRAGRGIAPVAIALITDHCLGPGALHRLEANVRPENAASRRVMDKLGFREEGLHRRYLMINGVYRDHIGYAVTVEDAPGGVLRRYLDAHGRC
jgi:ribosomal-protein-alanine N-acetyltransferase